MRKSTEPNTNTNKNSAVAVDAKLRFKLLCCALFVGLFTASASAANVTLLANDAFGTTSWTGSTNWSNKAIPNSTNDYFTGPYTLRTPEDALDHTFGGHSLTLQPPENSNGNFLEKGNAWNGTNQIMTVNNFTNAGGWIRAGVPNPGAGIVTIAGNVFAVTANSTISADQTSWIIASPMVGSGDFTNIIFGDRNYYVGYSGNNNGWTGRLRIENDGVGGLVILTNIDAAPGNPASFTPDQIAFDAAGTLVDEVGVNLANGNGGITVYAAGGVSNTVGVTTTISEPITGGSSFAYDGSGVLTLSGANTFAGGLALNGGQLNIKSTTALGTGMFTLNSSNAIIDNTSGSAISNANNNPITIGHSFTYAGSANNLNLGTGAVTLLVTPNLSVNAHALTIGGAISGAGFGINKQGAGTLVLGGANTFSGTLTVGASTVTLGSGTSLASTNIEVVSGATLDASLPGLTLASGAVLFGGGTVKGNVSTVSSSTFIQPGSDSVGTLTFNNNLDMSAGGSATFDVSTTASSGNDQIVVGGNLVLSSVGTIHLNALSGATSLDSSVDYILFQVAGTTTMTTTPSLVWDGTPPSNYLNYSLQKVGNNVVLHYSARIAPTVTATVNNSTVPRNGSFTVTATVTPGSGSIVSATVDLSSVGGSSAANLVSAGGNVWTNTFTVSGSTTLGTKSLTVTVTDNSSPPLTGGYVISPFNVVAVAQVWNGLGPDNIWSTGSNWVSTVPPLDGDSVTFAGTTRLTPRMDQNYSIAWLTFDGSAGRFLIGSDNSSTLTLAGGVTNNSTTPQTIDVPVTLSGDQTYEVAASGVLTNLADINGNASLAKTGDGTLILAGNNGFTGSLFVRSGTIIMSSGSINNGNNYSDVGRSNIDDATLTLKGTATFTNTADFNVGDLDFSTGTLNLEGNSVMSIENFFIGSANAAGSVASGTVNINGGTLIQRNTAFGTFVIGGRSSANPLNGTGVLNLTNGYVYSACGLRVGNYGTGTVNQYGGLLEATNNLSGITLLRQSQGVAGYYYLNGGILRTEKISSQQTTGIREFHFNGGILQAGNGNLGNAPFINSLSDAYVGAGGAIIDSQAYAIIIDQPLEHDPAVSGADGGLTKLGTGVLYLDGANTYTGNTVVSNGLLAGIGAIGSGSPVLVKAGGAIGGGVATNLGTLTINNSLTIQSGAFLRISKTGGVLANDSIACLGTVYYGGTLTISNVTADATPLIVGDTFTLFSATSQNANFANIVNANGSGTTYSFANGVLTVMSVGPDLTKNHLTNNITGGGTTLSLSWSPGWKLQRQTNSLSKGLSTNWITVTDGIATSTNAPIVSSNGCVFYRLISQ